MNFQNVFYTIQSHLQNRSRLLLIGSVNYCARYSWYLRCFMLSMHDWLLSDEIVLNDRINSIFSIASHVF